LPNQPITGPPDNITGRGLARQFSNRSVATAMVELQAQARINQSFQTNLREQTEEQKFNSAFSAAVVEAEKRQAAPGEKPRSRIIQVSSREEHEKQAMTVAGFVKTLANEFMT